MTTASSRVVLHDYSGHPGQAELSRALARRGYEVTHQHCPAYATGKGSLELEPGDPVTLEFEPCEIRTDFNRYSPLTRVRHEIEYGRKASRCIVAANPDVVIVSNVPLIAHAIISRRLRRRRIPMVFWHQDIYSAAITATARKRIPVLGRLIGVIAERVERSIARSSSGIVAISATFIEKLASWGVEHKSIVVPNWAPIDELPVHPRRERVERAHGVFGPPGRLVLRHTRSQARPEHPCGHRGRARTGASDAKVVVISEGKGREWLEGWKRDQGADNLVLLDFQPYEDLPHVLASADLLVAILEPDASKYSVPSKVLTYLCADRAILGVIPPDNSVAEILLNNQAGAIVDPAHRDQVASEVITLLNDDQQRMALGKSGREYAEREFSAERAADRFVSVFGAWVAEPQDAMIKQTFGSDGMSLGANERRQWEPSVQQAAS